MAKRAAKTAKAPATSRRKSGQQSKAVKAAAPVDQEPKAGKPKAKPAAKAKVAAKPPRTAPAASAKPKKPTASVAVNKRAGAKDATATSKAPASKPAKGATVKPAKAKPTKNASPKTGAAIDNKRSATAGKPKAASGAKKTNGKRTSGKTKGAPKPRYLAVELGQPTDPRGEPLGASSARAASDEDLQKYALTLWRQMQSGRVVNRYTRAIERAGLTVDEVWTAGLGDMRTTSSTADEIRRYRQKILFRANLLEAIFAETIADLRRLDGIEPGDAPEREPA